MVFEPRITWITYSYLHSLQSHYTSVISSHTNASSQSHNFQAISFHRRNVSSLLFFPNIVNSTYPLPNHTPTMTLSQNGPLVTWTPLNSWLEVENFHHLVVPTYFFIWTTFKVIRWITVLFIREISETSRKALATP